jgi:hypothetical protein
MTVRSSSSRLASGGAPPVRRNLFHSHLSRRGTNLSTSTTTSATTLIDGAHDAGGSEIVVRNPNGEYQRSFPTLTPSESEQPVDVATQEVEGKSLALSLSQSRFGGHAIEHSLIVRTAKLLEIYKNRARQSEPSGKDCQKCSVKSFCLGVRR